MRAYHKNWKVASAASCSSTNEYQCAIAGGRSGLTGKREHIYRAAMLEPHTAAELNLEQVWSLVDDLIEAHGDLLLEYHQLFPCGTAGQIEPALFDEFACGMFCP